MERPVRSSYPPNPYLHSTRACNQQFPSARIQVLGTFTEHCNLSTAGRLPPPSWDLGRRVLPPTDLLAVVGQAQEASRDSAVPSFQLAALAPTGGTFQGSGHLFTACVTATWWNLRTLKTCPCSHIVPTLVCSPIIYAEGRTPLPISLGRVHLLPTNFSWLCFHCPCGHLGVKRGHAEGTRKDTETVLLGDASLLYSPPLCTLAQLPPDPPVQVASLAPPRYSPGTRRSLLWFAGCP